MAEINICGVTAKAGEHAVGALPVTTLADGTFLDIPFHVLNGARSGPVLLLTAVYGKDGGRADPAPAP